jgi:hypothetical protein
MAECNSSLDDVANPDQIQLICIICSDPIGNCYAMINNEGETEKFHLECLESWLSHSKTGIITQIPIETYSIYENNECAQILQADTSYYSGMIFWHDFVEHIKFLLDPSPVEYDLTDDQDISEDEIGILCSICLCRICT